MSMKPWWQVAVPHRDIREGRLSDFAADLNSIVKGSAPIEYQDPQVFLSRTHFTRGLNNIVKDSLTALSGKGKSRIIQIQTPFGGGKTHALVLLYHLLKYGGRVSHMKEVRATLGANGVKDLPNVKVAVFVGTVPDPLQGKTPWGEIADQLGVYEKVKEHDKKRITPGREILQSVLEEAKPVLILIDEMTPYVVKAKDYEDQVLAFCQELTEAVNAVDQCVLVCTLPSSAAYGERGERILNQLQRIFGRMQIIYTPVEGEELYEILRKRLFEDLGDPDTHQTIVNEYFNLYQKLGEDIPYEARETQYRGKLLKAYPFHPELIDILFERWGSIPTFQRTRGTLRLLAEVVSDLYTRQYPSPLIQPCQINLSNPKIRRGFIEHIGEVFESVIASDISGEGAKAVRIDRQMGTEYSKFNLATGLAASIFFYSFSGGERRGTSIQRLRLAALREGIPSAIIGDALRRLEEQLWFLHFENDLYYFSNVVGLNRVIIDKEEVVTEDALEREFKERLGDIAGKDFDVYPWPKASSDIPDNRRLKMAILSCDLMANAPRTEQFIRQAINTYSTGFRTYKNNLIFLAADPNEYDGLKRAIRRFIALDTIKKEKQTMQRLSEEDRGRAEERLKETDTAIPTRIVSLYRYLVKAWRDGMKTYDLGIPTLGSGVSLTRRAKDFLRDQEQLLEKISSKVLMEKTFSKDDKQKTVDEVWESFLKFSELPILESEQVLRNAIVEGVREGTLGLQLEDKIWYRESISQDSVTEEALILRKELAQELKTKVGGPAPPPPTPGPIVDLVTTAAAKAFKRVTLSATIPWDKLSELVRGVITPLRNEGAKVSLDVKIEAESDKGISRDTLDLRVKETLNQIGANVTIQEAVPIAPSPPSDLAAIVQAGETYRIEFKSSLIWDYAKNNRNEELAAVIAKTVSAFMNSEGGTLIIGVSDDKKVLGLENDLRQLRRSDLDAFQQHFVNVINKYLGKTCGPLAKMSFEKLEDKDIAVVEVEKSLSPVWIRYKDSTGEREEFYIRSGNSNQPLNVREAHNYIRDHWPQH